MSGDLEIDLSHLLPIRRRLELLSRMRMDKLLEVLGSEQESQVRRRIHDEKTSPDGEKWDDWSEGYTARRPKRGGLLELDGGLIESIAFALDGDTLLVGSDLVYARVHQEGWKKKNIPARPYLGVSDDNLDDLGDLVIRFIEGEAGR